MVSRRWKRINVVVEFLASPIFGAMDAGSTVSDYPTSLGGTSNGSDMLVYTYSGTDWLKFDNTILIN